MPVTPITSYEHFEAIVGARHSSFIITLTVYADLERKACCDRFLGNVVWTLQDHLAYFRKVLRRGYRRRVLQGGCRHPGKDFPGSWNPSGEPHLVKERQYIDKPNDRCPHSFCSRMEIK